MAVFTLGLTSNSATGSRNFNLSETDVTRWINALKVSIAGGGGMNNNQLLATWANNVMDTLKEQVKNIEGEAARQQATANVVDIILT